MTNEFWKKRYEKRKKIALIQEANKVELELTVNRLDDSVTELIDVIDYNSSLLEGDEKRIILDCIEELNIISNNLTEKRG